MNMFRTLTAREIECRAQTVRENGLSLLLYKDARCDQNILDETVGEMNWQRHHNRDNANCVVSIWDEKKGVWIEKEDTGTESNTEKQKGLASDSFKRACVNWGIGRELYSAPFIWVTADGYTKKAGKNDPKDSFSVKLIEYNEHREISKLQIINDSTKKVVYSFGVKATKEPEPTAEPLPMEHTFCERCQKEIVDTKDKNGNLWTIPMIVQTSQKRHGGAIYCCKCMAALKKVKNGGTN